MKMASFIVELFGGVFMISASIYTITLILKASLDNLDGAPKKVLKMRDYLKKKKGLK